ncbi:MAG: universal stress protein [Deltaproteobacteria bacterium]|nr:universal stress protein [Deltaproteobacteria bacterium]
MKKAQEMIVRAGSSENQIATKLVDGSRSAASDILEEAKGSSYGTVLLGRKGQSAVKDYSMGSVAGKVLEASAGMTMPIVP